MAKEALHLPMRGGIVWSDTWEGLYEGPFTMLAKIGLVNRISPKEMCGLLFRASYIQSSYSATHPRSLVATHWIQLGGDSDLASLVTLIKSSSLHAVCGAWSRELASDDRIRFCQSCLDIGYQPAVFQIGGIVKCPLHLESLRDTCPSCGFPSPRYALDGLRREGLLCCGKCHKAYSRAWSSAGMMRDWQRPPINHGMERLQVWVASLKSAPIEWPQRHIWMVGMSASDRRILFFNVLRKLIPAELDEFCIAPDSRLLVAVVSSTAERAGISHRALERGRLAIYKSIRRHYYHAWRLKERNGVRFLAAHIDTDVTGGLICAEHQGSCLGYGFLLWRLRFEDSFRLASIAAGGRETLQIRLGMLHLAMGDSVWAQFVQLCLNADLDAAEHWNDRIGDLGSTVRAEPWQRALGELLVDLSPKLRLWPEQISLLRISRTASWHQSVLVRRSRGSSNQDSSGQQGTGRGHK